MRKSNRSQRDEPGLDRWPNLFIVGVARAGTTALASALGHHREIFMSSLKEPYFFSDRTMRYEPFPKEESAYLALFCAAGEAQWRGEASTAYFWDVESARRIQEASPSARILMSLRNPVARAYSGYWFAVKNGIEVRPFEEIVEAELASGPKVGEPPGHVRSGHYVEHVDRYMRIFGSRLHVFFFEDLVRDPAAQLRTILAFLDLDPASGNDLPWDRLNASAAPRGVVLRRLLASGWARRLGTLLPDTLRPYTDALLRGRIPPMADSMRRRLEQTYAADRRPLEALLGRPLPW